MRPVLAALVWLACALGSAGAWAHASLIGSDPADGAIVEQAPEILVLRFNEPVSPLVLRLVAPDRSVRELGDAALRGNDLTIPTPPGLDPGTYLLSWRAVSQDGHPVGGSLAFSIGVASDRPDAREEGAEGLKGAVWGARTLLYACLFLGLGGAVFRAWIAPGTALPPTSGRTILLALAAAPLLCMLSLGLQGLDAHGASWSAIRHSMVWRAGLSTSYAWTCLLCALGALAALAGWSAPSAPRRATSALGLILAGIGFALSGHASSAPPEWLSRPAVFVHVACVGLWVGSLLPLGATIGDGTPGGPSILRRFSAAMPLPIGALVLSGFMLAAVQLPPALASASAPYTLVLAAKLCLVAALLGLAAWNRYRLTPRIVAGDPEAAEALTRSILVELLLIGAILSCVALWRFTPPPRALVSEPPAIAVHLHGASIMAQVVVSPGRAGANTLTATLARDDGEAFDAKEVRVTVASPEAGIEAMRRDATPGGEGTWHAGDLILPLPGAWTVRLDVLVSDFESERLEGEFQVAP